MYGGPARPEAELATLHLNRARAAMIDERRVARADYSRVQLLPGSHAIQWLCEYGVSVMIEPSGFATRTASATVELQAGHGYSLHCDRTTGHGYRTFQWILDDTTGLVVAGDKKP